VRKPDTLSLARNYNAREFRISFCGQLRSLPRGKRIAGEAARDEEIRGMRELLVVLFPNKSLRAFSVYRRLSYRAKPITNCRGAIEQSKRSDRKQHTRIFHQSLARSGFDDRVPALGFRNRECAIGRATISFQINVRPLASPTPIS